jgi:sigma-B regulation protein RsbU (phosphoserine phosphatase)
MASLTARFSLHAPGLRTFLNRQEILLLIAVALFAVLKVTNWEGAEFGPVLIYTLVIGNVVWPAMDLLSPLSNRFRSPHNWFVYVFMLFFVALGSSAIALLATMAIYRAPLSVFRAQFKTSGWLGVIMVVIVGSLLRFYYDTRINLERRNLELQRTVEDGMIHSRAQEEEIGKAREIQEGLLPKRFPHMRGLEIAGTWRPARAIGGDFYDVIKLSDRKIGVCIGDVVGKGISAALLMANIQASFRAFASEATPPGILVGRMNEVMCNNIAPDKFITFCYCVLDVPGNKLTYAGAGHLPPILFRRAGTALALEEGGPPLGIFPDRAYEETTINVQSGDHLVLYTDGLTEAVDSEGIEFGERRLTGLGSRNVRLGASDLLETIANEVTRFNLGSLRDDLTVVVVSIK